MGTTLRLISGSPPIYACLNDGGPTGANINSTGHCRLVNVVYPSPSPLLPPTGQFPTGALRYALRPSEILSPASLRFINNSPYAAQGSDEADAGHLLTENFQESHSYLSQSPSTKNPPTTVNGNPTSSKLEDSKRKQPRVTFRGNHDLW
nr:hypothetical transcript [Hymenolepis microstoma]